MGGPFRTDRPRFASSADGRGEAPWKRMVAAFRCAPVWVARVARLARAGIAVIVALVSAAALAQSPSAPQRLSPVQAQSAADVQSQRSEASRPLRVAAAASLRGALDQALADWREAGGGPSLVTYAGTPALVRQIEQGLPADLFVSADAAWMDHLQSKGALRPGTRRDLLVNRLVLIAASDREALLPVAARTFAAPVELGGAGDGALRAALANWPGSTRLAIAEVASVPAGRYARGALEALDLWRAWSGRLAMTDNVRAALLLVARGETELGIVYASDAQAEPRVRVVGLLSESVHPPIRYPAAVLAATVHSRALEALEFLGGPVAMKRFVAAGFSQPPPLSAGAR